MNRLSEEKAKAIAAAYCTNGHNKSKALIDNGYAKSYANCGRREAVYKNEQVIKAIAAFIARISAKVENKAVDILRETMRIAYATNSAQISTGDKLRALEMCGKACQGGIWTDRHVTEGEEPAQLGEGDLTLLRTLARAVTDKGLSGPQLAPDKERTA
jgi:hypothetical protein